MKNLINSLLHYTDEDVPYDVLLEHYKRIYLSRFIFLSLFPIEERDTYNNIFNLIGEQANNEDLLITEKILNLIEDSSYPYSSELKVVAVYLVYGNDYLEKDICTPAQIKKAREVAAQLVSNHIWDLATLVH